MADALSRLPQVTYAANLEPKGSDDVICIVSWPSSRDLPPGAVPFHNVRQELFVAAGLLRCERFVVPVALTGRLLEAAHESHLGILRMKQ